MKNRTYKALKTKHLVICSLKKEDIPEIFEVLQKCQKDCFDQMSWEIPKTLQECYKFYENLDRDDLNFVILFENKIIGEIFLFELARKPKESKRIHSARFGFWIASEYQNRGFATEALQNFCRYAFEDLKIHKLFGGAFLENKTSQHVQEKVGFEMIGILKKEEIKNEKFYDKVLYELMAEDFRDNQK